MKTEITIRKSKVYFPENQYLIGSLKVGTVINYNDKTYIKIDMTENSSVTILGTYTYLKYCVFVNLETGNRSLFPEGDVIKENQIYTKLNIEAIRNE